jgi:integrase
MANAARTYQMANWRLSYEVLMRDLRHMEAAAATDLVDWLANLAVRNYSPKTLYDYGRGIAPLLRSHPAKTVGEFTTADIVAELALVPPLSRHIARSIYSSFFTWLLEDDRIDRNPVAKVMKIREPKRAVPDYFDDEEVALLTGLPTPDGELFAVLFGSGARKGDARQLQRRHINLNRSEITFVRGKGGKPATVPITAAAVAAVADLDLYEQLRPADYLWYQRRYPVGDVRRRGRIMGDSTFDVWYRRCIDEAGVRYLSPHKTRHTYGRWLKRQRTRDGSALFDLEDRAILMRHESTNTTKKYYPATDAHDLADRFRELKL